MGGLNRKILLVLDHCPSHPPNIVLRHVKLHFLPANCTSELQPMDLGIIRSFKDHYKRMLVTKALLSMEQKKDYKCSVLDALHFIASSWDNVGAETIANCFKKGGFSVSGGDEEMVDVDEVDSDFGEWHLLPGTDGIPFHDLACADDRIITTPVRNMEELIDDHQNREDDVDDEEEVLVKPTFANAMEALDTIKKFFMTSEMGDAQMNNFIRLESFVLKSRMASVNQTEITNFFGKIKG